MEETKPEASSKAAQANRVIRYHAIGAAAVGLVPAPLIDLALIAGIQLNLVRSLAKLYEMPFSEEIGKSLISALLGASVPGTAFSLMKFVPVIGMVGASAAGAASTYAVGKVFVQHFESGGSFLTFDPDRVREHYAREMKSGVAKATGMAEDEEDWGGIKP